MNTDLNDKLIDDSTDLDKRPPLIGGRISKKAAILLGIIVTTIIILATLILFKPKAPKQSLPETIIKVDVVVAKRENYPLRVNANGIVEADTRGNMVTQIQGEIVSVSEQFKTGGIFKKGDTLLQIDDRDYIAEVSRSLASLSQAKASYQQEQANAQQAETDWQRLGNTEPAPPLVLRKPQLAAAQAQLDSANAAYQSAQLNLERTKVKAPYTGRVIRRDAALGQFVSMGSVLGEIFATDVIEVKLPLSQYEYSQLGLENADLKQSPLTVILSSKLGNNTTTWQAKLTRTDSTFDPNTRQINAVATVDNPFSDSTQATLKIGQFVDAQIQGRIVENVFVLPNRSIREGSSVFVARDKRLIKLPIEVIWQDDKNTLVAAGLTDNELVVTTSLNGSVTGSKVKFAEPAANTETPSTGTKNNSVSPPKTQTYKGKTDGKNNIKTNQSAAES